jgi:tetratricopeptide (TPR) repeat protein
MSMRARKSVLFALLTALASNAGAQAHTTAAIAELRLKLLRHDWDGLEQAIALRQLRGDEESQVESRYVFAFDAFVSGDSALQPHLDSWVASSPSSAVARVARGLYFVQMAAAAKPRDEVQPTRASDREISRWVALAGADADAALRLDPAEVMAHVIRLEMIPLEWRGTETRDAYEAALRLRPSTLHGRALYLEQLTPRFDNPPSRMVRFADSAQRRVAVNPRLRVLRGMPAFEHARDLAVRERHDSAIVEFTHALAYGDYWQFRYERGMEYYRMDSLTKALVDLNRALAERPGHVPSLVGRALTFAHLAREREGSAHDDLMRRADEDVRVAALLDSRDADVRGVLNGSPPPGGWVLAGAPSTPPQSSVMPAPPPSGLDRPQNLLALRQLLLAGDFGRLDSAFAERRADAWRIPAHEARYIGALEIFDTGDRALEAPLDDWVARDTTNAFAFAARARYRVKRGWRARSTKSADDVTREQWKAMRSWLDLAGRDAVRSARLDTTDIAPHFTMLDATMLEGKDELTLRVLRDAVRRQPASLLIRARYMYSLRPAWGGSIEALERFANAQQPDARLNPRMSVLLGLADVQRGDDLDDDDEWQAALAAYTRALSYGRHGSFFYKRGRIYRKLEEPERAYADMEQAVAERPGSAETLAWRAVTALELSFEREGKAADLLLQRGREDFALATTFDAMDEDVLWVRKTYPTLAAGVKSPGRHSR